MLTEKQLAQDKTVVWEHLTERLGRPDSAFEARFQADFPRLHLLFHRLYGDVEGWLDSLAEVITLAAKSWRDRPSELKDQDAKRMADPTWFESQRMVGGVCYVDRFAGDLAGVRAQIPYFEELGLTYLHLMPLFRSPEGNNDGGYAVSSYRDVDPALGTMDDLQELTAALRKAGISPVVDFIFNHTAWDHDWAERAVAGDPYYEQFYLIFPDREMPDRYEQTVREIFPDDHAGTFVQLPDGRWIWSTFYHFQWDLNYANPEVFKAMAGEMMFLANQGVDVLRMDAVAFIWKRMGTACESLPEAHLLLQAFNAVMAMAAPSLLFKSEAIVHPDEVAEYIRPDECELSYNPLQMALTWEALATRDVSLLNQALVRRHGLPLGTAWVNYVRSHDDIGWTFADEDAAEFGIDGFNHRRFLNDFYTGRFPGTFAHGVPFQENPKTGDARVAGTAGSLIGLEQNAPGAENRLILAYAVAMSTGGIPLIYLGDEVGMLNDYYFRNRADEAADSRWVHRPYRPGAAYEARGDEGTMSGRIFARMRQLVEVRRDTPEFAGNQLIEFNTWKRSVLGYQRPGEDTVVLVLANFGDTAEYLEAKTFSGFRTDAADLLTGERALLTEGVWLDPGEFRWLRVQPR